MSTFLFNFKREFAALVESGQKLQTIRPLRKDGRRPAPGDLAKLYTGLRTKGTRWLRDGVVTRCQAVRMHFEQPGFIVLDGERLPVEELRRFAIADGFVSGNAMLAWFKDQYELDAQGCWEGFCVEWAR